MLIPGSKIMICGAQMTAVMMNNILPKLPLDIRHLILKTMRIHKVREQMRTMKLMSNTYFIRMTSTTIKLWIWMIN